MITGFNHLTIGVSDFEKSHMFYIKMLGFEPEGRWNNGAYLSAGDLWLCLSSDKASPASDYTHYAFSAKESDFDALVKRLKNAKVECWKLNSSEGNSFYFLDPDRHKLEIHSGDLKTRLKSLRINPYTDWSYPE